MEQYLEMLVENTSRPTKIVRAVLLVIVVFSLLLAIGLFLLWYFNRGEGTSIIPVILAVNMLIFAIIGFVIRTQLYYDYEYTAAGDDLTVTQIYNQTRRKTVGEYRLGDMKWAEPAESERASARLSDKSAERLNACFDKKDAWCLAFMESGRETYLVVKGAPEFMKYLREKRPSAFRKEPNT